MGQIDKRLAELGITLPVAAKPVANYVPWVRTGNLVFISGQGPVEDGKVVYPGCLGADVSLEDGAKSARLCGINVLAQLKDACGGDLDRVKRDGEIPVIVPALRAVDSIFTGGSRDRALRDPAAPLATTGVPLPVPAAQGPDSK